MKQKLTPQSLGDLKSVTKPLSLSDGSVFFLETAIDLEKNTYSVTLYRYFPESEDKVLYGQKGHTYQQLTLSPNEAWLTYLSQYQDKMQIFLQPVSGGQSFPLTSEKGGVREFVWSADSKTLYYWTESNEEAEKSEGLKEKDWPQATHATKLMHKADGGTFIEEGKTHALKKVTSLSVGAQPELVYQTPYSFSINYLTKDEEKLFLTGSRDLNNEWDWGSALYTLNLRNEKLEPFSHDLLADGRFYDIYMNNDESAALLWGDDFSNRFVTLTNLYLFDFEKGTLKNLTEDLDRDLGEAIVDDSQQNVQSYPVAHWINSEEFIFEVGDQAQTAIYRGNIQGEWEVIFSEPLRFTGIDWQQRSDLSAPIWVTYSTFTQPSQVGQLNLEKGELQSFYNPNKSFEETYHLVEPERFWIETDDKVKIQAWYLPPVGANDPYPAILNIHGGPQVNYGESFFHEMQVLASSGYGVIMMNPRGGSGYGQEFVASILGRYGTVDEHDLMTGIDFILGQYPEIDQKRLYVTGGSYGGFMTNWLVTHTNRFKAAATQRSICNWISFYGTSDIGPHFVEHQLMRDLSDVEGLWQLSPLAHADQLATPLLVLHGQEDHRCPLEQGEQIYRAALKQGVPTKLVTFPKSSHGLSREGLPHLRLARLQEILNWFDQHQ